MKAESLIYRGLNAELYDIFVGDNMHDESFYRFFIERMGGRSLELGCGTGRLMLSYLQQGLLVDGLDNSPEMLARCRQKAQKIALKPVLYEQAMQNMDISYRYSTLYVPFCSFMLIRDREEALTALQKCYEHLVPGGQLLISLYLPWQELEGYQPGTWRLRRQKKQTSDGALALCHEALTFQPWQQIQRGLFRYELYNNGVLTEHYMEELVIRWYGRDEMTMMLENVGFFVQTWYGDYTFEPASDHHETLLVLALRR